MHEDDYEGMDSEMSGDNLATEAGSAVVTGSIPIHPGLTEDESKEFEKLKHKTLKENGFRGWKRYTELCNKILDQIADDFYGE